MLGALVGDIIGSTYENENCKSKAFDLFPKGSRFTDDSVLTAAVADCLLHDRPYADAFRKFYSWYPKAGYGHMFSNWARRPELKAYYSYGNGSAMRVSPIAWAFDSIEEVLVEAEKSALPTHNHPEGIKGAEAICAATFLAIHGGSKEQIRTYVEDQFKYDLSFSLDDVRANYQFSAICQDTVPHAIVAFLEASDFEDAIRNAISIGGDSDTIACMTGGIAEGFYGGVPGDIMTQAEGLLDERLSGILNLFDQHYVSHVRSGPQTAF